MLEDYVKKAQSFLELNNKIVGIKFLNSKNSYDKAEADTIITKPIRYCVAVKSSMKGNSIKFNYENSKCNGSSKALGFTKLTENYYSGEEGVNLGLYNNNKVASKVANLSYMKKTSTYGILIKPLEDFKDDVDVVLIVGDSYNAMRIMQGYSYTYGVEHNITIGGNQAICIECTTTPYITDKINVSFLCSGTRHFSKWKKDDLAIGIPYEKFRGTIDGILNTSNAVEPDYKKKTIKRKLENENIEFKIELGETYYSNTNDNQKK